MAQSHVWCECEIRCNMLLLTGAIGATPDAPVSRALQLKLLPTHWQNTYVCFYVYVLFELLCVRQKHSMSAFPQQRQRPVIVQRPGLSLDWLLLWYRGRFSPEFQPNLIDWLWRENEAAAFWCPIVICIITFIQQGLNWKHEGQRPVLSTTLMSEPQYELTPFYFSHCSVTKDTRVQHVIYLIIVCWKQRLWSADFPITLTVYTPHNNLWYFNLPCSIRVLLLVVSHWTSVNICCTWWLFDPNLRFCQASIAMIYCILLYLIYVQSL